MSVTVHVFTKSGKLTPYRTKISQTVQTAVSQTKQYIPIGNIDIALYDNPRGAIPETGEGGWTENQNLIFISLNPEFKHFEKTLAYYLPRVVAHELHHAARWNTVERDGSLGEALISEGLAAHFEETVSNGKPSLWARAIEGEQLQSLIPRAKSDFTNKTYNHRAWFFGKGDPTIPRWAGYSIGYKLVSDYITKHPKETAATLYNKPAKDFV